MSGIPDLLLSGKEQTNNVSHPKWDYIVCFVVDLRHKHDFHITTRKYISLTGQMDNDFYFSERVADANLTDFLDTKVTNVVVDSPGVYRLVYGVSAKGSKYWTDCGWEYDAWEEYELLARYQYTEQEIAYLRDETNWTGC